MVLDLETIKRVPNCSKRKDFPTEGGIAVGKGRRILPAKKKEAT